MEKELTLIQAKRLVLIANDIKEATLQQYAERDALVDYIQSLPLYKESESEMLILQEKGQKKLKDWFDKWQEELNKAGALKKGAKNKRVSELNVEYNKFIEECRKEINEEAKKVTEKSNNEVVGTVEIPDWLQIPAGDYLLYFKDREFDIAKAEEMYKM